MLQKFWDRIVLRRVSEAFLAKSVHIYRQGDPYFRWTTDYPMRRLNLFIIQARVRSEILGAIAPLLIPAREGDRTRSAYRLISGLMSPKESVPRDFLWREESPGVFTILSGREPDGFLPLFDVDVRPFEPRFSAGERVGFRLRASPSVTRSQGAGKPAKRHDVIMDALHLLPTSERAVRRPTVIQTEGFGWLARQGDMHGFVPDSDHLHVYRYRHIAVPQSADRSAEICTLDLEGIISVQAPDLFLQAVRSGIGGGRSFGCGLMLLSSSRLL